MSVICELQVVVGALCVDVVETCLVRVNQGVLVSLYNLYEGQGTNYYSDAAFR